VRRLGEILAKQKALGAMNTGATGIGTSAVPEENPTPTLFEIGIDKKLSLQAQKLGAIEGRGADCYPMSYPKRMPEAMRFGIFVLTL
jgi:hypothetical protein